ncbi:MAG TPA: hypothetical protein VMH87_06945 [Pseudomonadales bacterium]|nr:hypothetical protein [Pseudomonadales bacterium]
MKLGKLLAAGTSIMKGHMDISYRSSKQIYLPKFVSPKNPFQAQAAQPVAETASHVDSPAAVEEVSVPSAVLPLEQAVARPTRLAPPEAPVAAPVKTVAPKTQQIQAVSSGSEKKGGWAGKLSPKSIFKAVAPKTVGQPNPEGAGKPTETQAELSLDSVRVVHNDLTDVDVEVVPIKSRSTPPENKPVKKSWEALGERLFGVEAT